MENSIRHALRTCLNRGLPLLRWLVAGALSTALVLADGMIIGEDPHLGHWSLQQERSQLCLINYENGIERMLVSVALSDLHGTKAAWIVPIPSAPDNTAIGIVKGFPALEGNDILHRAEGVLAKQFRRMSLTQLYPVLFLCRPRPEMEFGEVRGVPGAGSEKVSVHSHREEMGLTAELVTAEHPGAIYGYLEEKGVELPDEVRPMLDKYRTDSFAFVVTWISNSSAFMRESLTAPEREAITPAIGVSVSFPTRRAFFPLRPTSVYDYVRVPIDVYAIGHPTPQFRRQISQEAGQWVDYLTQTDYQVPEALQTFFNGRKHIKRLDYTHVHIDAESWTLSWDLWFKPDPPLSVTCAQVLSDYPLVWIPLIFLLCSCLSSLIAGAICLRRFRLPLLRQACFGLWNCLTLLGFAAATALAKFRESGSPNSLSSDVTPRSAGAIRKALFILLFTAIFQALLGLSYLAFRTIL
jgi:hypothetical protein